MEINNGWKEWSKYVLKELERISDQQTKIEKDIHNISIEIAMLKVKSGVWGLIGGALPVGVFLFVEFLKSK